MADEQTDKLDLQPDGKDYLLTRVDKDGNRIQMLFSEENVIVLAQSARQLMDHILAQQEPMSWC